MDATNRNTALASAMVEELARCGVRHAVVSPGSRSTPLAIALWRQPSIDVTVLVDERSAGFFALGAAQATRRPVVLLSTSGTAAANYHPAIAEADESAVPLIVLTADRPPELRGIGAGQTIDQLKLYGSAVRWFCEVGIHDADDDGLLHFRSVACRAFAAARGESRPGPVHLNIPWREPLAPIAVDGDVTATNPLALEGRGERPLSAVAGAPAQPDPALLDELAERIAETPRGLILAGRIADSVHREAISALARASGYPILAEPTSQLRYGEHERDLVLAFYDAIARLRPAALEPELVIRAGEMPTSKALRLWIAALPGCRQILIDPHWGWNEPSRHAETIVRADLVATATGLTARLTSGGPAEWADAWHTANEAAGEALAAAIADAPGLNEPALHLALGGSYADGDIVYTASSMPIRDQEAFLRPGGADALFLCNRGANGIDGLISSGIGAAHATGRRTVILTGDLGLLHDIGGLAAVRDLSTPVRIIVVNNNGGGIFHLLPQAEVMETDEFEALLGTPRGVDVATAAQMFGLGHVAIDDLSQLGAALDETGGLLIEVRTDRHADAELRHRLGRSVGKALHSTQ